MNYTYDGVTSYTFSSPTYTMGHIIPGFTDNEPSPIADKLIGIIMVLCTIFGTPANVTALIYFGFKQKTGATGGLLTILYVTISANSILICVSHLPVTISLLCDRNPVLFANVSFCDFWECFYNALPYFSIYLVMLLTVTRTISIIQPFRQIPQLTVLLLVLGYAFLLLLHLLLKYIFESGWYVREMGMCIPTANPGPMAVVWINVVHSLSIVQILLPSVIITISFTLSVRGLLRRPTARVGGKAVLRKVSVTIALFTAMFLFWNLPLFVFMCLHLLSALLPGAGYPEPFFTSPFMGSYLMVLAKVLFVVLNATSNPVLYICRIKEFAKWLGLRKSSGVQKGKVLNNFKYLVPLTQTLTLNPAVKSVRA